MQNTVKKHREEIVALFGCDINELLGLASETAVA